MELLEVFYSRHRLKTSVINSLILHESSRFTHFCTSKKKDAVKKARKSDSFYGVFALDVYIIAKCEVDVNTLHRLHRIICNSFLCLF